MLFWLAICFDLHVRAWLYMVMCFFCIKLLWKFSLYISGSQAVGHDPIMGCRSVLIGSRTAKKNMLNSLNDLNPHFQRYLESPRWENLRSQLKQTWAKACRNIYIELNIWARLTKLPPIIVSLSPNDEQFRLHCNQRSGREWQLAANWSRRVRKGPLRLSSDSDRIFTEAQTARQNDSSLYIISVVVGTVRCISLDLAKNCHLNG